MKPGFTTGNTHLGKGVWTWTLPAGITCPGALLCKAWTDESGCLKRGGGSKFCCYAARAERFPNVRLKARLNYDLVRNGAREEIADIIHLMIPIKAKKIRIHAGGDFFSLDYTLASLERGAHSITATISDANGNEKIRSQPVVFHMKQNTIIAPRAVGPGVRPVPRPTPRGG